MLKPVEKSWQPQDFLPEPSSEEFFDNIREIRDRAAEIPDEYFVSLVGNMITEEALPTYQTVVNTVDGVRDDTGASNMSWAVWTRMWTAEENRHGDLLNRYLYLSGKCDMRQIEKTIQYLIGSGMDNGVDSNPYQGYLYTSFQERATFITHGNTARLANQYGDKNLAKICGLIAADEKRHEKAYTKVVEMLFQLDPDTMMQAFANMMKKKIKMPGILMFDGQDENLFDHFESLSAKIGLLTRKDYVDMVEFFVKRWNVEEITDLSGEGRKAQEYVCTLAEKYKKLEEYLEEKRKKTKMPEQMVRFSWIFNKSVMI